MTIEEMKKLKKAFGYSNKKLSEESGVPIGTVNKVFSGASANPRIDTIRMLAAPLLSACHQADVQDNKTATNLIKDAALIDASLIKEESAVYKNTPSSKHRHSILDYYELPDERRPELFEGTFFDMASPSIIHQRIVLSLCFQINSFIRSGNGPCEVFPSPVDVQPDPEDQYTILQPDVMIVCQPEKITPKGILGAPDFIAEVVSGSSISMDYYKKTYKYEASGVREYWIIDPQKKTVLINRFEQKVPPQILPLTGRVELAIYEGQLFIDLDEIAACIR